jgi:hypothetical protein
MLANQHSQFRNRLAAAADVKLVQNIPDVVLGGTGLHPQAPGNFFRRTTAVDQICDLKFTRGQRIADDRP